jgi:HK97 gp10 family phage protein
VSIRWLGAGERVRVRGNAVEVMGDKELIKAFRKFGDRGFDAAAGVTKQTTENVRAEARRRAPRDRPVLRDSLVTKFEFVKGGAGKRKGVVRARGFVTHTRDGSHARLQEFGTRHHPAKPFLFPALESYRARHLQRLRSALATLIQRTSAT